MRRKGSAAKMSPPVVERRAATLTTDDATSIGVAMATALTPLLSALGEDKDQRHAVANTAQSALELATVNKTVISHLEKRLDALMGDGSGENGMMAAMSRKINTTESNLVEVKGDVKALVKEMAQANAQLQQQSQVQGQAKSFMDGWKGVSIAVSSVVGVFGLIGGIVSVVLWLYKH